jgi:hypothetical protein
MVEKRQFNVRLTEDQAFRIQSICELAEKRLHVQLSPTAVIEACVKFASASPSFVLANLEGEARPNLALDANRAEFERHALSIPVAQREVFLKNSMIDEVEQLEYRAIWKREGKSNAK